MHLSSHTFSQNKLIPKTLERAKKIFSKKTQKNIKFNIFKFLSLKEIKKI